VKAARSRSRSSRQRPKKVLVFGEDQNDTRAIAAFIRAACPDANFSIEPYRRPPILLRDAKPEDVPDRVAVVTSLIDAALVDSDVIAIFAHEDCDKVEPAHEVLGKKIEAAYASAGYVVSAAAPAWETEAWLFLWPDAFKEYRPKWRSIDKYKGRNVGLIVDAKEELVRALRPTGKTAVRDYRESDAPALVEIIAKRGWVRAPMGSSASFQAFIAKAASLCPPPAPESA